MKRCGLSVVNISSATEYNEQYKLATGRNDHGPDPLLAVDYFVMAPDWRPQFPPEFGHRSWPNAGNLSRVSSSVPGSTS